LLVAGLVIAVGAAASDCVPAPTDLVGWWPGDGGANDIASTNSGTLQGGATASAVGVVGSAFGFDGTNGFVRIPDSPAFHPTNLTIEAWVRFDSLDSAGSGGAYPGEQYIVFKQNTHSNNFEGFFLGKARLASRDFFVFGVSSASGQATELDSVATVTTGLWYHVAGARGSNFIQLYVNGQLDSQTNISFPLDYGTNALYFGTSGQAYWDRKFHGALDEVSLYNRALAAGEIAAIYSAGGLGKCKAPSLSISLSVMDTQNVAALIIGGLVNQTYGIEITTDPGQPAAWIGLTNLTLDAPTNVWQDPVPATLPQRFYRVVPGPIPIP
jgi:hypothetical protein